MKRHWSFAIGALLALAAPAVPAATLYDNGPLSDGDSQGRCDSGFSPSCGGSTGYWTFYDDFRLSGDAVVTAFDYVDYFFFSDPSEYVETSWSFFAGDPFTTAPLASGTAVAALTATGGTPDEYRFSVSGLALALSAGDYWLGISNTMTNDGTTTVARVPNPGAGLDTSKASDGGANDLDFPSFENRAFRVHGTLVPEPSSGALLGLGLAALATARRGRQRA